MALMALCIGAKTKQDNNSLGFGFIRIKNNKFYSTN